MQNGSVDEPQPIVRIWGPPLDAVIAQVIEYVKTSGHRASVLHGRTTELLPLAEEGGVRLALLFLAVKPLRKLRRVEAIASAIREMEPEEAYYWLAKCTRPGASRRACHALRVLLSKE
jgi:hypothetical protein